MNISTAKVMNLFVKNIIPNPHNPRRLFDEEPMKVLSESIDKLGILVPLDVYPKESEKSDSEKDTFVLLDGERRWRCSKELDLESVPCIIVDTPSDERNILTMFHIHNVREGWQLMPTALKLQDLIEILGTSNERNLAELTKLSISQIRRCKILLSYPTKYQERMLTPLPSDRFKADFFIDLQRIRGPAREDKLKPWVDRGDENCIDIMIKKYEDEVIKAVTEFRQLVSIYRASEKKGKLKKFEKELDKFFKNPLMKISDIEIPGATFALEIKEITKSTKRLISQLNEVDIENLSTDENLINELKQLTKIINGKLNDALLYTPRENLQ